MKLNDILNIKPQIKGYESSGREPSLKELISKYYNREFTPEETEAFVDSYLSSLKEEIYSAHTELKVGDRVEVISQVGNDEYTGVDIGDVGIITLIDSSDYPIDVRFNYGETVAFMREELKYAGDL